MEKQLPMDGDAASRLDGLTPQQLVSEVRQISAQYAQEVPGQRRRWPESIRSRVLALGRLGVTPTRIAALTDISRATVFLWCRKLPRRPRSQAKKGTGIGFIELPASPTVRIQDRHPTVGLQAASPTVRLSDGAAPDDFRITLAAPDGFRFEFSGPSAWQAARHAYADLKTDSAREGRRP